MTTKWVIFLLLPYLASSEFNELKRTKLKASSREKIEQNPRNRAFAESFQSLHSFGVMQRQEEQKKKRRTTGQKASP